MKNKYQYPHTSKYDRFAKKLYLLFSNKSLTSRYKFDRLPIKDKDYWRALAEISTKENLWQTPQPSP